MPFQMIYGSSKPSYLSRNRLDGFDALSDDKRFIYSPAQRVRLLRGEVGDVQAERVRPVLEQREDEHLTPVAAHLARQRVAVVPPVQQKHVHRRLRPVRVERVLPCGCESRRADRQV